MSKKKKIILCFLAVCLLVISGCGCKSNSSSYRIKLEVWGLFDDEETYAEILDNYRKMNANVADIEYRKFTPDTYKQELLDALAAGNGPDIFLINNTWLPSFADKLISAPQTILNEQKYRSDFVDVAANDFLSQGQVYAAPLSVDSLALYYNKDLFNEAGITGPPQTWDDFVADVKLLTKIDRNGNIVQSGAAIGTAYNINRSTDILNLLMMQGKAQMFDPQKGQAAFDKGIPFGNNFIFPGENALSFYTQFAKSNSSFYTWNPTLHYSIDLFGENKLAMLINYSWQVATITAKAPKLNFAIAPIPQLSGNPKVNYANYWGYAVAKNKVVKNMADPTKPSQISNETRIMESWKLLRYLTTKPEADINTLYATGNNKIDAKYDPALAYAQKTRKPAARLDIISLQKSDPIFGVFAEQNLIARSWFQANPEAIEAILAEMINEVNLGRSEPRDAIKAAAARVNQLIRQ